MSYFPSTKVSFLDSANVDSFGRLRVNAPTTTLFDDTQHYGDMTGVWENSVSGSGSVSAVVSESCMKLSTGGGALGWRAYRATKEHFHYQPGKSQLIMQTFVFDSGSQAGVRRRIGYFDGDNGYYVEQSGSFVGLVERNSISGSVVNTFVSQSAWNIDKFDGTGPSGVTLDLSKGQILVTDIQWLGTGRVRMGFDIGGVILYAHHFLHANIIGSTYMTTANLSCRCEVENIATAVTTGSMRQICSVVVSEGGSELNRALQHSDNNGITGKVVTARVPVFSLRAKTVGPNGVRNKGRIIPVHADILAGGASALWEIVLNGTLTSASFADHDTSDSLAQIDSASTAISGGHVIDSGYAPNGAGGGATARGQSIAEFFQNFPLVYSSLLDQQDVLSIVCTSLGGNATMNTDITWQEQF